jgi:SAM-dependent MidA family methyltransferase
MAMDAALYGPGGFFVGPAGPRDHFRTSVHASPLFAGAILRLIERVDAALSRPDVLHVVDIGAGRGELLTALSALASEPGAAAAATMPVAPAAQAAAGELPLARRLRLTAVEKAARPDALPGHIAWVDTPPAPLTGVLVATEWLDNVPVDVAEVDGAGVARLVLVAADGTETLGDPVEGADLAWLERWWPLDGAPPGTRAEIGRTRDDAWAAAVATIDRGVALAVDYGHLRDERPGAGSLTGYRSGRQVEPVPDGSTDLTAHVATDAVAAATGCAYSLVMQREALRALGVDGGRPPLALATTDPAGYLRALGAAGAAAELTDPAGLGGHHWLLHAVGVDLRGIVPC